MIKPLNNKHLNNTFLKMQFIKKQYLFVMLLLFMSLFCTTLIFALDIATTPESGSIAVIETGFPQKITLLLSNYQSNESVNLTVITSPDLNIINSTNYNYITGNSIDVFVSSTSSNYGTKNILFIFRSNTNSLNNVNITYEIQLVPVASPPIIVEAKPDGVQTNSIVTIKVVTNKIASCKFDVSNKDYQSMTYSFMQTGVLHVETWQLEDGDYSYFVRCTDNSSNVMQTSKVISFHVDTKGPNIIYTSPKFTVTKNTVDLVVRTNEDAVCKYAITDVDYNYMTSFDVSDKKDHYKTLRNLKSGTQIYYVQCVDTFGNLGDVSQIMFSVSQPPKASIQLSTPSPIKAGTIGVTVVASQELKSNPILTYVLNGVSETKIPLTGSGNLYTGYMIIDNSNDNKVGEFKIQMINLDDVSGTEIISGNTFMVQTKILPKIKYISAIADMNKTITLRWYLDKDQSDAQYYNIYRQDKADVTNLDFYKKVDTTEFIDFDTEPRKTYYYKVAGVDSAGNVGLLSEIASATSADSAKKGLTLEQVSKVESLRQEINILYDDLSEITYDVKLNQFKNYKSVLDSTIKKINETLLKIEELNDKEMTDEELIRTLDNYRVELINNKNLVVSSITIEKQKDTFVSSSIEDVPSFTDEYLNAKRLTDMPTKLIKDYITENQEITGELVTTVTVTKYTVKLFNGDINTYSILSFKISSKNIYDADVLLYIPKSIAGDINELNFGTARYTTITRDPLVSFDFSNKDNYNVDVFVSKEITDRDISDLKTVFLKKPTELINSLDNKKQGVNAITGNAIASTVGFLKNNIYVTMGTIIIIGLVAYLFFTGRRTTVFRIPVDNNVQSSINSKEKLNDTQAMIEELKNSMKK